MKDILYLTLHRKWFDLIVKGEKKFEYRLATSFWKNRIEGRSYTDIFFRNGYYQNSPTMRIEYLGWQFGEFESKKVYVLALGKIKEISNYFPEIQTSMSID